MVIKISCKYIKDNAFDITVGQETRTITHENNQAVFKLSESKNYNIEICKKSCKSNHSFSNLLIFFFTMILQGIFNILLINIDSKWYNKLSLYIIKTNFNVFIDKDTDFEFIYNEGFCIVHEFMQVEELLDLKAEHPDAKVLVHPECNHKIIEIADFIGSTSGIINFAGESSDKEFIIGTECGVLTKLKERRPDAEFYFPETTPTCVNMKKITPEKVLHVLKTGENEIHAKPETEGAAKNALARMLELAGK